MTNDDQIVFSGVTKTGNYEPEVVIINNRKFKHDLYFDILIASGRKTPNIACPKCHNLEFGIGYIDGECVAHCSCGHKMLICYDL